MRREPLPPLFGRDIAAIHCVGVAGMGVGPLAIYLSQRGFRVSGEDDGMTEAMRAQLEAEKIVLTPSGVIPPECELVAYSSAISPTHPAYVAAKARGLTLVRRGELLAEATRDKKLVAVCGSHGKTTTTAMLITVLRTAGVPAGYVLGGLSTTLRSHPRGPVRTSGSSPKSTRVTARSIVFRRRSPSPRTSIGITRTGIVESRTSRRHSKRSSGAPGSRRC